MKFEPTLLEGTYTIEAEPVQDERGSFARIFCAEAFAAVGCDPRVAQCSTSYNRSRGTLRGLHYQAPPHAESKLIRCVAGAIYDVVLDLRPRSATFTRWIAVELSAANGRMIHIPPGCAHGFQTLQDNTEVFYLISVPYAPECSRGIRWNDPAFDIRWPNAERTISARDRTYPDFAR